MSPSPEAGPTSPRPAADRPRRLTPEEVRGDPALWPCVRQLLATDSVTLLLCSWLGYVPRVRVVEQVEGPLPGELAGCLRSRAGVEALHRRVEFRSRRDVRLMDATAHVLTGRVPPEARQSLRETATPLGLVLSPLGPRRHPLGWYVTRPRTGCGPAVLSLTARVDVGSRPVAQVRERIRLVPTLTGQGG